MMVLTLRACKIDFSIGYVSSPTDLGKVVAYINMRLNDFQDKVTSGSHFLPNR